MTALARGGVPPTGTSHQFLKKKKKRKGKGQDKTKEKRKRDEIKQKKIPGSGGGNSMVNDSRLWGSSVFSEVRAPGSHWKERKEVASNHPGRGCGLILESLLFGF